MFSGLQGVCTRELSQKKEGNFSKILILLMSFSYLETNAAHHTAVTQMFVLFVTQLSRPPA